MKTTQTRTGTYVHLETRDILTELDKASRKWPGRPRASQVPVLPSQDWRTDRENVQSRFIAHLEQRLNSSPDGIDVHLFDTRKPQTANLNQAVTDWANHKNVCLIDVNPEHWGFA